MKHEERVSQINAGQWELLRGFLERETGMDFADSRFGRLRSAVGRVLALNPQLHLEGSHPETQLPPAFVEAVTAELTIGESFFFRNHAHFEALRQHVLPQILADNAHRREIRLWSAGCAAGEEPYSLGILLDQLLGRQSPWNVTILGTDLNPAFLQRGRQGWYRPWSFRHTDIHLESRYFTFRDGGYQLCDRIRDQVRFAYLNLVKDAFPSPLNGTAGMDLILFRNVAIYLKPEVTAAILRRFWDALRPGGWLLLGESEVGQGSAAPFAVRRFPSATFYQKPASAAASDEAAAQAIPPLADTGTWRSVKVPVVPTVPHWVPLPAIQAASTSSAQQPSAQDATPIPPPRTGTSPPQQGNRLPGPVSPATATTSTVPGTSGRPDTGQAALASDPRERAREHLRQAHVLLGQAQMAEARRQLELAVEDDPLLLEAYLMKAGLAEEAGDLAAAEQACRRALYLDRACCIAHFHLALVQQQQGRRAEAAKSIRTVLQLIENRDPHDLVEFGDGVCFGRLREMAQMFGPGSQP